MTMMMSKYSGVIYKFTSPNGKVYIGQTSQEKRRFLQHRIEAKRCPNKYHFTRALNKYGFDSFKYEVLERITADSFAELRSMLNDLEIFYIKQYNSFDGRYGYNRTPGGRFNNPESCLVGLLKGRETQKKRRLDPNYIEPSAKPIVQYTMNGEYVARFKSAKEAGRKTKISQGNITQVCIGHKRSAGGFVWKYEGESFSIKSPKEPKYRSRPVCQYDGNGELVSEYRSAREAAKAVNSSQSVIRNCCLKIKRMAKGYFWAFKGEEPTIRQAIKQRKIAQYSTEGKLLNIYESSLDAMRKTGISGACIRQATKIKTQKTGGYLWRRI